MEAPLLVGRHVGDSRVDVVLPYVTVEKFAAFKTRNCDCNHSGVAFPLNTVHFPGTVPARNAVPVLIAGNRCELVPRWWVFFVELLMGVLRRSPTAEALDDFGRDRLPRLRLVPGALCAFCREHFVEDMRRLMEEVKAQLLSVYMEVSTPSLPRIGACLYRPLFIVGLGTHRARGDQSST